MKSDAKNFTGKIKPIIFWYGFPVCGLLLKKVADEWKDDLIILATRGAYPFENAEELLGHKITWLENPDDIWKRKDEFTDRNLIIHTGWTYKGWLKYDKYLKKKNNAKTVVAVDNRYRGDFRQLIGAFWFRLYLKRYFDAVLVPGKEGQKLMEFLGMEDKEIYTGLYGAYEGIFKETNPIEIRNKEFLFIGQLIERKSVDILIEAFTKYRRDGGAWNLRIIGDGPLKDICKGDGIILEGFLQPEDVARKMNQAKVLILPSKDDNWGTVVCEAAACGMHVIATTSVAASADIIEEGINGITLQEINTNSIYGSFLYYENLKESSLIEGSRISKEIASKYNSNGYYDSFLAIVKNLIS